MMKLKFLVASVAALFVLQTGPALSAATAASTSSGAAPKPAVTAKAKVAKPKAAAKPVAQAGGAKKKVATRSSGRKVARVAAAKVAAASAAAAASASDDVVVALDAHGQPVLGSNAFYVVNQSTGEVLLERNAGAVLPIASITKLMTAIVVLDAAQGLSEPLTIEEGDIDRLKGTGSRLAMGTTLSREEMLNLALMSSENRAASALARHYPGGEDAFVVAMNVKARLLGMSNTRFLDSTGLNPGNVSSPADLARLVAAASSYPLIREFSTADERHVSVRGRLTRFGNTNGLVRSPEWAISVSKTGYISEAGRCLVMQAWLKQQPVVMVLMDSNGRYTRTADARRVRKWLEQSATERLAAAPQRVGG